MITKTQEQLTDLIKRIFLATGADERNADVVSEHLVLANLSGVDTHGVWHVSGYVEAIAEEHIVPTAWPESVDEAPSWALVSGNWTFGQVAARYAMEVAIEKAKAQGVALVGITQSHHIGRLGHFAEMAAEQGMISMIWSSGYGREDPISVPHGGRERFLSTNPLAMGFPAGDEPAMVLDFATTTLAGVKAINAQRRNEPLPPGAAVDKDGNPTRDPEACFDGGGYLPFGGHKGYALLMAIEYLGRIFCGADARADPKRGGVHMRHQGISMMAFKADLFQPMVEYKHLADELQQQARAIAPAPGFKEVLVPGDPETRTRAIRQRDGIPIADDVWKSISDTAKELGVAQ